MYYMYELLRAFAQQQQPLATHARTPRRAVHRARRLPRFFHAVSSSVYCGGAPLPYQFHTHMHASLPTETTCFPSGAHLAMVTSSECAAPIERSADVRRSHTCTSPEAVQASRKSDEEPSIGGERSMWVRRRSLLGSC